MTALDLDLPALWAQQIPRTIADYDEKGFPLLDRECPNPACGALALILNEWDAAECLSCSWREFGPDSPSADCDKWPDEAYATAPEWQAPRPVEVVVAEGGRL